MSSHDSFRGRILFFVYSGRLCKRIMWSPSISVDSLHWNSAIYAKMLGQISGAGRNAHNCKNPGSSSIFALFGSCGPSAVLWRIALIIIDSVQRQARRWFTHVGQEVPKIKPSPTDSNAPTPIIEPCGIIWIETSPHHLTPSDIDGSSLSNPGVSMLEGCSLANFPGKAAAGFSISSTQIVSDDYGMATTITIAEILQNSFAIWVDFWGAIAKHFKSSKATTDQGYFLRHGIGLSMFMFSIGERYTALTDAKFLMNCAV